MPHVDTSPSSDALFVAPDLDHFETPAPVVFADDVTISDRAFRRLDPPYYAWLRQKMLAAKRATDIGRLAAAVFAELRRRFEAVTAWAVRRFGEESLRGAVQTFDPRTYDPPRPDEDEDGFPGVPARTPPRGPRDGGSLHDYPDQGAWPFTEPVTADAVALVDAIRDEALAAGWSLAALYQNRGRIAFPCGAEWGLVCFLGEGATVAGVARSAITIERPRGATTRFPNPDVAQPWRRHSVLAVAAR